MTPIEMLEAMNTVQRYNRFGYKIAIIQIMNCTNGSWLIMLGDGMSSVDAITVQNNDLKQVIERAYEIWLTYPKGSNAA